MVYVLLTGAGFSRNWGGWLASEVFEYLIGSRVGDDIRRLLWECKRKGGGFEDVLADMQNDFACGPNPITKSRLDVLRLALGSMFAEMNTGIAATTFEPSGNSHTLLRNFLVRFDAIFTLNQDLLLEYHYLDDNVALSSARRWVGWQMPGLKFLHPNAHSDANVAKVAKRTPDSTTFQEAANLQPYYKLHGSSNWCGDAGESMLIMGGNKAIDIDQYPLLRWYSTKFTEYLGRPKVRLMVIGYSFGDSHVNKTIADAAHGGGLELFIVDPQGVDVLDRLPLGAPPRSARTLKKNFDRYVIGASRRSLNSIFSNDHVEFRKLMRFFER